MKRREKILILIATVVVLYGAVELFVLSPSDSRTQEQVDIKSSAAPENVIRQIHKDLTFLDEQVENNRQKDSLFSMIASGWETDPFEKGELPPEKTSGKTVKEDSPDFRYSGFISFKNSILAVVDGVEYAIGETIKGSSYKITRVSRETVTLTHDETHQTIVLQLQED